LSTRDPETIQELAPLLDSYFQETTNRFVFGPVEAVDRDRLDRSEKYMAMLKISNVAKALIQNHIYGDIIKRQITGEFRIRLGK
jgi:hypothetical protein